MISTRRILLLIVANSLLLLCAIFRFVYYHQWAVGVTDPEQALQWQFMLLNMVTGILIIVIYFGLFKVITFFNEPRWLQVGLYVFITNKIIAVFSPIVVISIPALQDHIPEALKATRTFLDLSMLLVFFILTRVSNPIISKYHRSFGLICIILTVIAFVGPLLYSRYNFTWLLSTGPLYHLPFIVSLLLFLSLFKPSRSVSDDTNFSLE